MSVFFGEKNHATRGSRKFHLIPCTVYRPVPSLQHLSERERNWYLQGTALDWELEQQRVLLRKMAQAGYKVCHIDPVLAFSGVKQIALQAGEVLIEAGSPPGFVYIPLGPGLIGTPLGGY